MRRTTVIIAAVMVAGCAKPQTWAPTMAPDILAHWPDRMKERFPELQSVFGPSCIWRLGADGSQVPTEQCFKMGERRRWRGVWRRETHGSTFCPEPLSICTRPISGPWMWLTVPDDEAEPPGVYEVEFIGRQTLHRISYRWVDNNHEVIVERMISAKKIPEPGESASM
jgi:hypothetical protein